MPVDIDSILKKKAFETIEPKQLEVMKALAQKLKSKSPAEAVALIMAFMNSMPKGSAFTKEQRRNMLEAIIEDLNEQERSSFKRIANML